MKNERPVSGQPESRMKWITSGWPTQELADSDSFLRSLLQQLLPVCDDGDRFRRRFREH